MMLNFLRTSAQGVVIKVLMIILALTFVLWGVGDVLRHRNKVVAFTVGDTEYTDIDWERAYRKQLAVIEEQLGKKFSEDDQAALGIRRAILNQLISRALLLQEAKNLGILISDDMVKFEISAMPGFVKDGKFDKEVFERVLRSTGLSESQFVAMLKEDMTTQNLELVQTINKEMPDSYITNLAKAKGETRVVKTFRITNSAQLPAPKDDELQNIYKVNSDRFSTPETRDINYLVFGIDDIKTEKTASEAELKEHYESNKLMFTEPEKRKVQQLVFKTKAEAEEAAKMFQEGKTFEEVSKKNFPDKTNFLLGEDVTQKSFDKEISQAIFSTEEGKTSAPTQSPLGWHIFKIDSVKASKTKSFDEVKAKLKAQFEEEARFEALTKLTQEVDKDISMGANLKDVAQKFSLKASTIKNWKNGDKLADVMTANNKFISASFTTEKGNVSPVAAFQGNDKFFVLEVENISPKTPKSFESVKAEVVKMWEDKARHDQLEQKAKNVLTSLRGAQNISEVVQSQGLQMQSDIKISLLDASKSSLPAALKEEIFKLDMGKFTFPVADSKDSYMIAQLDKTIPMDPAQLEEGRKLAQLEIAGTIGGEMMAQYLSYLHNKYKVVVYEEVIKL